MFCMLVMELLESFRGDCPICLHAACDWFEHILFSMVLQHRLTYIMIYKHENDRNKSMNAYRVSLHVIVTEKKIRFCSVCMLSLL